MSTLTSLTKNSIHYPVPTDNLTSSCLREYFINTWELYVMLFSSIKSPKTYYLNPDPLRNPLIFYWGHTAAFYINKLRAAGLIEKGINAHYEHIFAVGVDPDSPENLDKTNLWPSVDEVNQYRQKVYDIVLGVIETFPSGENMNEDSPWWTLMMGLEHDRIHFETSSMLFRQLPTECLKRPEEWCYGPTFGVPARNEMIKVEGGKIALGKPTDAPVFGWDNEYGHLDVIVQPFMASKNLISNAEYLQFVLSGAYNDQKFWTAEGWNWKNTVQATYPKFWVKGRDTFLYRTVFELIAMPLDWPAEVNAHEAWAFCHWKGTDYRLLSEAEFKIIAKDTLMQKGEPACSDQYNINMAYGSPTPVGFMDQDQKEQSFNDVFGNVWDWLNNDFYPLPGFKAHPQYKDFSAPFFDTDHSMLLGGAWATTGAGASSYYRLWFRRHFFQHAGFRLAKNQ
jgi:5-histidylcysteine sulfoxide synthase